MHHRRRVNFKTLALDDTHASFMLCTLGRLGLLYYGVFGLDWLWLYRGSNAVLEV